MNAVTHPLTPTPLPPHDLRADLEAMTILLADKYVSVGLVHHMTCEQVEAVAAAIRHVDLDAAVGLLSTHSAWADSTDKHAGDQDPEFSDEALAEVRAQITAMPSPTDPPQQVSTSRQVQALATGTLLQGADGTRWSNFGPHWLPSSGPYREVTAGQLADTLAPLEVLHTPATTE